jgi:hypothetical protein
MASKGYKKMKLRYLSQSVVGTVLFFYCSSGMAQQNVSGTADTVLYNGNVLTVDTDAGDFTVAQAVAIRDGKILSVGSDNQVMRLTGNQTQSIDLNGRTVIPGIIDTHTHPQQYAGYRTAPEMAPEIAATHMIAGPGLGTSMQERLIDLLGRLESRIVQDLQSPAEQNPWLYYLLRSAPGDVTTYFFRTYDRYDLDDLTTERPVLVDSDSNLMVNSAALEALQEKVPLVDLDPELDENGVPTGRLGARAASIVTAVAPTMRRAFFPGKNRVPYMRRIELLARSFRAELRDHWARYGVTTIASKLNAEGHAALTLLEREGSMPVRWAYHVERPTPIYVRRCHLRKSILKYAI